MKKLIYPIIALVALTTLSCAAPTPKPEHTVLTSNQAKELLTLLQRTDLHGNEAVEFVNLETTLVNIANNR